MRRLFLSALLLAACATVPPPAASDIATAVKRIAQRYSASTHLDGDRTTYQIYALRPARGYRNKFILTEDPQGTALSVAIYEQMMGAHRITVLVDQPLDGKLDYLVTAHGPSSRDADALIRAGRGSLSRHVDDAQQIYNDLLANLLVARQPPSYRTAATQ